MQEDKKIDEVVMVENDEAVARAIIMRYGDIKSINHYRRPEELLKDISRYPLDTIILLDNDIPGSKRGVDVARMLHDLGYKHLYLFTSEDINPSDLPDYLSLMTKNQSEKLKEIFGE